MLNGSQIKRNVIDELMRQLDEESFELKLPDGNKLARSDLRRALEASLIVADPQLINVPTTRGELGEVTWYPHHVQLNCPDEVQFIEPDLVAEIATQLGVEDPGKLTCTEAIDMVTAELERRGWQTECHDDPHSDRFVAIGLPPDAD